MIRFKFTSEDLLRVRFAVSPIFELSWSVGVLCDPEATALHDPWATAARRRLGSLDISVLEALLAMGRGYAPDFLSPPPDVPNPALADELAAVLAVPPERIARETRWRVEVDPTAEPVLRDLIEHPDREIGPLVELMAEYWQRAVAPWWPQVRALLEADVDRRSRAAARGGAVALFADLHPDVEWREGALEMRRELEVDVVLGGRGLLLVPSAFAWPNAFAVIDEPWQPSIVYTPKAVGELWAPPGTASALRELLGPRRADVLVAVGAPASTGEVAERLGASLASVNEHLGVLRRAGLVRGDREGRVVRYRRTPAGDALLRAVRTGK